MSKCDKCKKETPNLYLTQGSRLWLCDTCYPFARLNSWSELEKLQSRSLRPDGSVAIGREGIRLTDEKLRKQEYNEKYRQI